MLEFKFSSTPSGANLTDWQSVEFADIGFSDVGGPSLATIAGRPAIACNHTAAGLGFGFSQSTSGTLLSDWQFILADPGTNLGIDAELLSVEGLPFVVHALNETPAKLRLSHSLTAEGRNAEDWVNGEILSGADDLDSGTFSVADIHGFLAAAYLNDLGDLRYVIRF
jgi:hypothetical protein